MLTTQKFTLTTYDLKLYRDNGRLIIHNNRIVYYLYYSAEAL